MKKLILLSFLISFCVTQLNAVYRKVFASESNEATYVFKKLNDLVFVGRENGVEVYNTTDTSSPELITTFCNHGTFDMHLENSIAYLATTNGLYIYNISEIENPELLFNFDTGYSKTIDIWNNYLFINNGGSDPQSIGYYIFSILDPNNPVLLNHIQDFQGFGNRMKTIDVHNDILFIGADTDNWEYRLNLFDLSNPSNPVFINSIEIQNIKSIKFQDQLAFITTGGPVQVVDVSNPTNLEIIQNIPLYCDRIALNSDIIYCHSREKGFDVFDISDIQNPILISRFQTPHNLHSKYNDLFIDSQTRTLYIGYDYNNGFNLFDVSNCGNQFLLATVEDSYSSLIQINETQNVIASTEDNFSIINFNNPLEPELVSFFDFPTAYITQHFLDALLVDNILYVIIYESEDFYQGSFLHKIDVSDLNNPTLISSTQINSSYVFDFEYYDSHFFVFQGSNIKVYDMNINETTTIPYAGKFEISDDTLYFRFENSLIMANIEDIFSPYLISEIELTTNISDFSIHNNAAYLVCNDSFKILDVSDSYNPILVDTINYHPSSQVTIQPKIINNNLFISDLYWNEIFIYDLQDPLSLSLLTNYKWNLTSYDFLLIDGYLTTSNSYYGLSTLDYNSLTLIEENEIIVQNIDDISNFPNPFSPSTTISFSIPEQSKIQIMIYNIKGQKVKTVTNESFDKGNHSVVWNGVDDSGRKVSSGIYFYKMNVNGKSKAIKKCLLLK